jgi:biotin synthase
MPSTLYLEKPVSPLIEQPVTIRRSLPASSRPAEANRWTVQDVRALFELPFPNLLHRAQTVHREHFDPTVIEFATLLSIKTGGCPEDCSYCPQAARYDTGVEASKLMKPTEVLQAAPRRAARRESRCGSHLRIMLALMP